MGDPLDHPEETSMSSYLWIAAFIAGWILLQAWILPRLGIST